MSDRERMDKVLAEAVRQGFQVWQTSGGAWVFRRGDLRVSYRRTPATAEEWMTLINTLRAAGFRWYAED